MHTRLIPLAGLWALSAFTAAATNPPEIVVTATRTPLSVTQVPAASSVLTRDDIERLQLHSLPEALRALNGVDLTESGGAGKSTGVFLRGTESDHVLVLVNGIRIGSVSAGLTSFELLPMEQIDRIELIRGPRASQWGSEAIGGTIQIFTRQGSSEPRAFASAGGGAFDSYAITGGAGAAADRSNYHVDASYFTTGGFDARQAVPGPFGVDQPDDDGYESASIHARIGHEFATGVKTDAFVWRASGVTEFDGNFQDETDFVQQVIGGAVGFDFTTWWDLHLRVGESRDESENFAPDGEISSRFDTKRREFILQNNISVGTNGILTLGGDFRHEQLDSDVNFAETSRYNSGLFAQLLTAFGNHHMLVSVRYDDNEAFDSETTGGLGWNFQWGNGIRIYASYGTAFKAPSFNELYFPDFGNPALDPETSDSYELGLEGRQVWGEWGAHVYYTSIDDLIATVFDPVSGTFFPENVDRARIKGWELEISTGLAGWKLAAVASLLDPVDRLTGKRLRRRVKKSLGVEMHTDIGRWTIGGRLAAQGDRFEDAENTIRLPGYGTFDLMGEYRFNPRVSIRAKVGNLFDKQYQTADTFNSADRNVFVSLHYRSGR